MFSDLQDPTSLKKDIHLTTWVNGHNHILLIAEPLGYLMASHPRRGGAFGQDFCIIHHPNETLAIRQHLIQGPQHFSDNEKVLKKSTRKEPSVSFEDHKGSDNRFRTMKSVPLNQTWAVANGIDPSRLQGSISWLSEFREQAVALT